MTSWRKRRPAMAPRKGVKNNKATAGQVAKRTHEVKLLILSGAARYEIIRYASENRWRLTDRQIDTYIARASDMIHQELEPENKQALELSLSRHRMLFSRALEQGDVRTALAVLASEARLRRLIGDTNGSSQSSDGSSSTASGTTNGTASAAGNGTGAIATLFAELRATLDARRGQLSGTATSDPAAPAVDPATGPTDPSVPLSG